MKKISLAVLLWHWLTAGTAQQQYSKAVSEQLARVEASVWGGLTIDGKLYSLTERMKHHNVICPFYFRGMNGGFDPSAIKKASEILSQQNQLITLW